VDAIVGDRSVGEQRHRNRGISNRGIVHAPPAAAVLPGTSRQS
jgi:hypothetical protein